MDTYGSKAPTDIAAKRQRQIDVVNRRLKSLSPALRGLLLSSVSHVALFASLPATFPRARP